MPASQTGGSTESTGRCSSIFTSFTSWSTNMLHSGPCVVSRTGRCVFVRSAQLMISLAVVKLCGPLSAQLGLFPCRCGFAGDMATRAERGRILGFPAPFLLAPGVGDQPVSQPVTHTGTLSQSLERRGVMVAGGLYGRNGFFSAVRRSGLSPLFFLLLFCCVRWSSPPTSSRLVDSLLLGPWFCWGSNVLLPNQPSL